jgi:hypothetical protein
MHTDSEQQGPLERRLRQLRALPAEVRQPYDWAEFRRREREKRLAQARERLNQRRYAAIAAAAALVVVGVAAWVRVSPSLARREAEERALMRAQEIARAQELARRGDPPGYVLPGNLTNPGTAAQTSERGIDNAEQRVDIAERWLARLPHEPIVVRVGTRAAVTGLEDRIAQLDDTLSAARAEGTQPAKLAPLEQQRERLVSSLVQVRYAEALAASN